MIYADASKENMIFVSSAGSSVKLEFGNKEQIEALKEASKKAPFCPRCNALGIEYWDEGCGDYAECENCRIVWYEEKGRVKIEEW